MKRILQALILGLLVLPFSACFRKKAAISNLQNWLDKHYPGRFEVLSTGPDDAIQNLSFKVKRSLVAEKANPLVQTQLKWDKRQPDFDLTTAMVDSAFAQTKTTLDDAQDLHRRLKEKGFEKIAVGIKKWTVVVLLFEEPTDENRHRLLSQLELVFGSWPKSSTYDKQILLMEAAAQDSLPGEILALSYFLEGDGLYERQALYSLQLPHSQVFEAAELHEDWMYNTQNEQFSKVPDKAKSALETWAKQQVKQPYFLMETIESEQISLQPLRFRFRFPFTDKSHEEAVSQSRYVEVDGHFSVDYDVDKDVALNIEIIRE